MLGIDPIKGPKIMELAGLSVDDLQVPNRFEKIKEVVDYFQHKQDYGYWITKLTKGEQDKLHKLHGWVRLRREKDVLENEIREIRSSADRLPPESLLKIEETAEEVKKIDEQIGVYES